MLGEVLGWIAPVNRSSELHQKELLRNVGRLSNGGMWGDSPATCRRPCNRSTRTRDRDCVAEATTFLEGTMTQTSEHHAAARRA